MVLCSCFSSRCFICDVACLGMGYFLKSISKLTFWGQLFCQTIAKWSDLIVQIGQSAPFGRVLFRALARTLAVCKTLRERTFYEVKYSVLYFTWKLDRICAKILDKILRI